MFWDEREAVQRPGAGFRLGAAGRAWDRLVQYVKSAYRADADRRFLWVPVCLAAGAGVYFTLSNEPSWALCAGPLLAGLCLLWALRGRLFMVPAVALCLVLTGLVLAKARTELLMTPVVAHNTGFVRVTGWVERAEPKGKNRIRAMIRVSGIAPWPQAALPERLRITFSRAAADLSAGQAVAFRAKLFKPRRPAAPGGFDFARRNWFRGIGGSGFAIGSIETPDLQAAKPFDIAAFEALGRVRKAIADEITRQLSGDAGAFVVAILTGQRGAIPETVTEDLRRSGLGHLLAISGLHMALVAGTLFWLIRSVLALSARAALTWPIKKWAAGIALAGGAFYLALSGASVSTQRAFIMVAIMFAAVILDRPAITMRNVALAALVMVVFRPESVVDVSFQMSFLAVVGLVALFEFREDLRSGDTRSAGWSGPVGRAGSRVALYVLGVALTTIIASLATGPLAAYHFHRMAVFGVVANLVAVPLMAMVIMPFALLAVIAMPFGLAGPFLQVVDVGVRGVLDVAGWAAALPGAVHHVATVPLPAILATVFGILWLCLWRAGWRVLGLAIVAAGVGLSGTAPRPDALIEEEGGVIAVRAADGRLALSSARAARFAVKRWLAADGSGMTAKQAVAHGEVTCDPDACAARLRNGMELALVMHPRALWDACRRADIVITRFSFATACRSAQIVIDRRALSRHGAHALYVGEQGVSMRTVSQAVGERPWSGPGVVRRDKGRQGRNERTTRYERNRR